MDYQGFSNHETKVESLNDITIQLKAFARAICVFLAWMTIFSHMDEIGSTLWAIWSLAVLPVFALNAVGLRMTTRHDAPAWAPAARHTFAAPPRAKGPAP